MKITAQEEYGLRLLIRIGSCAPGTGMTITQLSELEGISHHYAAKLTRELRLAGFINSTPGNKGGYVLSRPSEEIIVNDVLKALGGALFDENFCNAHAGALHLCNNSVDCSVRSLWKMVQFTTDHLLSKVSLKDLINPEQESSHILETILAESLQQMAPSAQVGTGREAELH